jgi:hypothetical protein
MSLIDRFISSTPKATVGAPGLMAAMRSQVRPAAPSQLVVVAIPATSIAKGATQPIAISVQESFKGERIVLSNEPGYFLVTSVKIGRKEQLISTAGIPGRAFHHKSQRTYGLNMEPCRTDLQITITVQNLDTTAPHTVQGMILGTCGGCNDQGASCGLPVPGGVLSEPLVAIAVPVTKVAKGTTQAISFSIQETFKAQQLVVPTQHWDMSLAAPALTDTSFQFSITSIKVGRKEQLITKDALPADAFSSDSQAAIGFDMEKCRTDLQMTITVTNNDAANDHDFVATFYGFCGENGNCNDTGCSVSPSVSPGRYLGTNGAQVSLPLGMRPLGGALPGVPDIR